MPNYQIEPTPDQKRALQAAWWDLKNADDVDFVEAEKRFLTIFEDVYGPEN